MNSMPIKILRGFESCFYPSEDKISLDKEAKITHSHIPTTKKITDFTSNMFRATLCLIALPMSIPIYIGDSLAKRVYSIFKPPKKNLDIDEAQNETNDESIYDLPKDHGFAASLFQSCGLGTDYSQPPFEGKSSWNDWFKKGHIELKEGQTLDDFFVNYLDDPKTLIKILKKAGATSFRISLERSILESKRGQYDHSAIKKYQNLCKQLKKNGIEPWITLEHFVQPDWFSDSGGFENEDNIDDFVKYTDFIIPKFKDHVKNFMTFNEPTAFVFQTYIREAYPNIKGAGNKYIRAAKALRNILITHIKVYQSIKAKYPDLQIGIVHQFLKFKPFNKYNPIERLVCYYYSIITHYAAYNFFKTNKFAFQLPFLSNIKLDVPKDQKITDFIGLQCYGYPLVKSGFNGGKTYPGYKVTNLSFPKLRSGLTFGSVCEENSRVQSFGMRDHPEGLENALKKAAKLNIPIAITETGSDDYGWHWGKKGFEVDKQAQKEYFVKVFKILAKFKNKLPLKGLFFWTLLGRGKEGEREGGELEWERGSNVCLGLVDFEKDKNHKIKSYTLSPAAEYIKSVFDKAKPYFVKEKVA